MKKISDEKDFVLLLGCSELKPLLARKSFKAYSVKTLKQALKPQKGQRVRAIIIQPTHVPNFSTQDALPALKEVWPFVDLIIWHPKAGPSYVRNSLKTGARDVLLNNSLQNCVDEVVSIIEMQKILPRTEAKSSESGGLRRHFEGMYTQDKRLWDLFDTAVQIANTDANVLILGETGTGKELLARAIHKYSDRKGRFVPVNCGALSESLAGSELFGHEKGAFTGAFHSKDGLFKYAQGGTLFLDEVGTLPMTIQHQLLRVLQEGALRVVGGKEEEEVDVRVITATGDPLESLVKRGKFREDLFYRFDVIRLEVPPLRERPNDVFYLFFHFLKKMTNEYNVEEIDYSEDFLDELVSYDWPGNVRQLENFTERLILTAKGVQVNSDHFKKLIPFHKKATLKGTEKKFNTRSSVDSEIDWSLPLDKVLKKQNDKLEKEYLERCLENCKGKIFLASDLSGMSRRTLLRKMKKYSLNKEDYKDL